MTTRFLIYILTLSIVIAGCGKEHIPASDDEQPAAINMFANPLLGSGPNPSVAQRDSFYFYTHTTGDRIVVYRVSKLSYLQHAYRKTIWAPPSDSLYSQGISAPKMYSIQGKWYVYFTAYDGIEAHRRIYVIENDSENPLMGNWNFKGKIAAATDRWSAGGTLLEYGNESYFIWSGRQDDNNSFAQQLYIARMTNPWTISGEPVMIAEPLYDWEKSTPINEAPEILKNSDGDIFLVYSAGSCSTDDYCMGMLSLKANGNPLNPQDWKKSLNPVFSTEANSGAYGPGHSGFFKSPDGKEDWMIYDANSGPGDGCGSSRSPRIQKFTWKADGTPDFGVPVRIDSLITRPSGD